MGTVQGARDPDRGQRVRHPARCSGQGPEGTRYMCQRTGAAAENIRRTAKRRWQRTGAAGWQLEAGAEARGRKQGPQVREHRAEDRTGGQGWGNRKPAGGKVQNASSKRQGKNGGTEGKIKKTSQTVRQKAGGKAVRKMQGARTE